MTAVQKIAMGLLFVILTAPFGGYDAVPDPVGWVLVLFGLRQLGPALPARATLTALAVLSGVISTALWFPAVSSSVADSTGWLLSLPQVVFAVVLCGEVARLLGPGDPVTGRFAVLRWVFVVVAAAPVLVYGGGLDALTVPVAVLSVGANVYLVYLLFRVSRRVPAPPAS